MSFMSVLSRLRASLSSGNDGFESSPSPVELELIVAEPEPEVLEPPLEASIWDEKTANQFLKYLKSSAEWFTKCASRELGSVFDTVYDRAWDQARRGKDPNPILATLYASHSAIDITKHFQDGVEDLFVREFVEHVGKKIVELMSRPALQRYDIREAMLRLPDEKKVECLDILGTALEQFTRNRYRLSPARETRIRRFYDVRRTDGNVKELLGKAKANARQGDVEGTMRALSILERKALGDWTPEVYKTYALAHTVNFERAFGKGRRALSKGRLEQATRYLLKAEQHAIDAELPFRFGDEETVAQYITKKNQFEAYREARDMYVARQHLVNQLGAIVKSR